MADILSSDIPKQPLKRVELHLNKFNEVAIPHHVDLLKRHKCNIEKFRDGSDWEKVHREQINATRLVKQLKALIYEMDMLRNQVQESDLQKFDKLTAVARQSALDAISEYLEMNPQRQSPIWLAPKRPLEGAAESNSSQEVSRAQLQLSLSKEDLQKQEACLKSWESLQTEVKDVHALFEQFAQVVHSQKEDVDVIEQNIETAAENVTEGEKNLRRAVKYKSAMYPLAGAVIGGCLGGPIGLVAGMKLGGLAALGCGVIGFTGGTFLKKKQEEDINVNEVELLTLNTNRGIKGSVSLPTIAEKHPDAAVNKDPTP